jgi:uncharacterized protein (TIGR00661 family)
MIMSRVLYGVSGEGSGHSSRALEIGRYLQSQGHEVHVVSYDRGSRNLSPYFTVSEIEGLHICSENNRVRPLKTLWDNLCRSRSAIRKLKALSNLFDTFQPDVVLTDFEPSTAWMARWKGVPLISVDNQHRMRYMQIKSPWRLAFSRLVTSTVIRLMIPPPDAALATTYFFGPVKNDRTFLFPPILRKEVLLRKPSLDNHHLVYVTTHFDHLLTVLTQFPDQHFIVYGSNRSGQQGNLTFKDFSAEGFLVDLESCQSVIGTAGFTLISEAIYLGKPYLSLPMHGQFEQQLNALCLEELGFGINAREMTPRVLGEFLKTLPAMRERVQTYARMNHIDDPDAANEEVCHKLEEQIAWLSSTLTTGQKYLRR